MSAPFKRILVLDFETYWDSKAGYTLSKMTNEEYVRDKRFHAHGVGYKFLGDKRARWVSHDALPSLFEGFDWSTTAVLAHNAQFDISILSWHYDAHPCFILDSLSMARALYGVDVGNSLAKLADRFGLPPKGNAVYSTDGLRELTLEIERELADYCAHDVALCEAIYERMTPGFPVKEKRLIDMTLKMYTEPKLVLDTPLLSESVQAEAEKRGALLKRLNASDKDLGNNDRMACFIAELGYKPPKKKSPTTGKMIWAFAKNDAEFQALLNSENEDLAALCEARLLVKSTSERTRGGRFLDIAQRGLLPVPLKYYGAHTGRWGGDGKINLQSLKRGSFLRDSIMAPPGYKLVAADLSQIEPRVLASLSDYTDLLEMFKSDDVYSMFGRQTFCMPTLNKKDNPDLRQAAKSQMLGAGYGLGWASFAAQQLVGFLGAPPVRYGKEFAKQLGITAADVDKFLSWNVNLEKMAEIPHTCTEQELLVHCLASKAIIDKYRDTAQPVVSFWRMCDELIGRSLYGGEEVTYKCLAFSKEKIRLPNGMFLKYPDLRKKEDKETGKVGWVYGPHETYLYGGRLVENIVQSVARIVMTDGMLRIQKKYDVVLTVHDEAICLVPEHEGDAEVKAWVVEQMTVEPSYLPGVPLGAEAGVGKRYGDAK